MILKNKSIRFNSLDKMDDLQEQLSVDKQNFGKFVFVSSWTSNPEENIPMWKMYTKGNQGVRIKLPVNPFEEYEQDIVELSKIFDAKYQAGDENVKMPYNLIVPTAECFGKNYFLCNYASNKQLFKIEYTDNRSLLYPQVLNLNTENFNVALSKLGKYKNLYWEFQEEWRYILMFLPVSVSNMKQELFGGKVSREMYELQKNIIAGQSCLPFDDYYLTIKEEAFKQMEVTLSPYASESVKTVVELLVKEYNSDCKIFESKLMNLIS